MVKIHPLNPYLKQVLKNWDSSEPYYRNSVVKLWASRRQTSHPLEIILLTAHAFTEDTRLWQYSNECLDLLRDWFYFRKTI